MPRKPRQLSVTSIYHIVIRGLDRQIMFDCANDYRKYLEIVSLHKEECHFECYAYCLMSNHVHILIKTTDIPLETIFRKINTHYAVWFNMKYQRSGHLQQERFYSEPVDDSQYFLNVIRYIHQNPLKAGLENVPGESYEWSSIHEYLTSDFRLIDSAEVFKIISHGELLRFVQEKNADQCLDIDKIRKRIPDDVAKEIICEITGYENCLLIQNVELIKRNEYIKEFVKHGISIRQINRLTGIPVGIIQRAK